MSNWKQWGKATLKITFSLAAVYLVYTRLEGEDLTGKFSGLRWGYLLPALLLFVASQLVSSFRLLYYFRSTGLEMPAVLNHKLYGLGMFYNLFLPGGIGGDGYKVFWINKKFGTKTKSLVTALLLDRFSGLIALIILITALGAGALEPWLGSWWWLAFPATGLGVIVYYFLSGKLFPGYQSVFLPAHGLALGVQLLQLGAASCLLLAVSGESTSLWDYGLLFLLSSIAAVFPLSIGGLGAREMAFVYGAEWLGLEAATGFTISLLFYLLTALVSLSGVWFLFRPDQLDSGS